MDNTQDVSQDASFESGYDNEPTVTPVIAKPEEKQVEATQAAAVVDPIQELKARLDKYEAGHNTLAGTVGGLNRTQKEMQTLLAAAQTATKKVDDAPTQSEVSQAITDPAEWAELKRQYPEWGAATEKGMDARIEARLAQQKAQTMDQAAIDKLVEERVAGKSAAIRTEVIDAHLDAVVDGNWREVVLSPEFVEWEKTQSEQVKALGTSSKMTDAAKMLRLFEASKKATQSIKRSEASARQKRIEAAVTPRGSGGHTASNADIDSFESGYSS